MIRSKNDNLFLIRLQRLGWYGALLLFGAIVLVNFVSGDCDEILGQIAIIYIIALTMIKLYFIADRFRRLKSIAMAVISYILILVMLLLFLMRYMV